MKQGQTPVHSCARQSRAHLLKMNSRQQLLEEIHERVKILDDVKSRVGSCTINIKGIFNRAQETLLDWSLWV